MKCALTTCPHLPFSSLRYETEDEGKSQRALRGSTRWQFFTPAPKRSAAVAADPR